MSEPDTAVRRWEAPSFEPPRETLPQVDLAQQEALAREQGFAQGLAEGRQEGLAQAGAVLARLGSLLDELAQPYRDLDQVVTQELVHTATRIARHILRRELAVDSSLVKEAVAESMATLSNVAGEVEIVLNPADTALIRELAPELIDAPLWKLREDAALLPGGCRLKTPISYVDASIERQLETLLATLIEACEDTPDN